MFKRYGKGDRIFVQAQQIWLILTSHSVFQPDTSEWGKGIITYSDLAELMGKSRQAARTLDRQLGTVGYYCLENGLPPLNAVVVNQETGMPGSYVVETKPGSWKRDQKKVLKQDWFSVRPPSIRALRLVYEARIAG